MTVNFKLPQIPFDHAISDQKGGLLSAIWNQFLNAVMGRVRGSEWIVASTSLTAQAAAITATALGPSLPAGLYGVRWYGRVTQAATSSSSLQITVTWTDGAVAQSFIGAAVTGNTTASLESGTVGMFHADAGTQVKYAAAYSSTGATPMQYRLDAVLFRTGEL